MLNLYIIYAIVSIITIIIINVLKRANIQTTLIHFVIIVCLPVVGWVFPLIWIKQNKHSHEAFTNYIDKQQQEHYYYPNSYNPIEKHKELNIVPLEDALVISNYQDRRRALIEILKQDTIKYIEKLQRAISNEDTETSHYAVSAIMEIKSQLLTKMQELEVKYEEANNNAEMMEAYLEVLSTYLKSGFLDARAKRKYQYTYLFVLKNYLENIGPSEHYLAEKLNVEMELGLIADAEQTATLYVSSYPHSEHSYLCLLKYYFTLKSNKKFKETLNRLKHAPIKLTNEGITMVRYWSKGDSDEANIKL